jgi:hypothetical protein
VFDDVYSNETGSFYKEFRKACKKEHQHAQGNNQTVDFWLPLSSRSSFGLVHSDQPKDTKRNIQHFEQMVIPEKVSNERDQTQHRVRTGQEKLNSRTFKVMYQEIQGLKG